MPFLAVNDVAKIGGCILSPLSGEILNEMLPLKGLHIITQRENIFHRNKLLDSSGAQDLNSLAAPIERFCSYLFACFENGYIRYPRKGCF